MKNQCETSLCPQLPLTYLEIETILQGRDTLEGMNFHIKYNFMLENMLWLVCLDQLSFSQYLKKIKTD